MWQRYNQTTHIFEKSIDNGASWAPLPLSAGIITEGTIPNVAYKNAENTFVNPSGAGVRQIFSGLSTQLIFNETVAPATGRMWDIAVYGQVFYLRCLSDDGNTTTLVPLRMDRNGDAFFTRNITNYGILKVESNSPTLTMREADATLDNKAWRWVVEDRSLYLQVLNDAETGGANIISISRTGDFVLASGHLHFPTAANPSTGQNVLDDYREGAITLTDGSGAGIGINGGGTYVKIGRNVTVMVQIITPATTNGAATVWTGLPFTSAGNAALAPGYHGVGPAMSPIPTYWVNGNNIQPLQNAAGIANSAYSGSNIVLCGSYISSN